MQWNILIFDTQNFSVMHLPLQTKSWVLARQNKNIRSFIDYWSYKA